MFTVVALVLGPAGPSQAQARASSDSAAANGAMTASGSGTITSLTPTPTRPDPTPTPVTQLTGYVWPMSGGNVSLPFEATGWGEFIVGGDKFHDGVDMATWCGDRIVAAHEGTVLAAGRHFDDFLGWRGPLSPYYDRLTAKHLWNFLPIVVVIDDGNGYRSIYAHMSALTVKVDQHLKAGQLLGYEGMTGNATGCHLHYGLFSPIETLDFGLDAGVAGRMLLPPAETARVNPLLVLPYRNEVEEMRSLRPLEAAAWALGFGSERLANPTPSPSPSPSPSLSPSPRSSPSPSPSPRSSPRSSTAP